MGAKAKMNIWTLERKCGGGGELHNEKLENSTWRDCPSPINFKEKH